MIASVRTYVHLVRHATPPDTGYDFVRIGVVVVLFRREKLDPTPTRRTGAVGRCDGCEEKQDVALY